MISASNSTIRTHTVSYLGWNYFKMPSKIISEKNPKESLVSEIHSRKRDNFGFEFYNSYSHSFLPGWKLFGEAFQNNLRKNPKKALLFAIPSRKKYNSGLRCAALRQFGGSEIGFYSDSEGWNLLTICKLDVQYLTKTWLTYLFSPSINPWRISLEVPWILGC